MDTNIKRMLEEASKALETSTRPVFAMLTGPEPKVKIASMKYHGNNVLEIEEWLSGVKLYIRQECLLGVRIG